MGYIDKMREREASLEEKEEAFNKFIIAEYLKYGSVDEVFKANDFSLPISYAGVQRLLDRWGIVKAAGPNTMLSESIGFLVRLVETKIPLESLYRRMPTSFTPSMTTLHRIYRNVKKDVRKEIEKRDMRRVGTALIVTGETKRQILIGHDVSTPRLDLGKAYGAVSLPMGFSKRTEARKDSVIRVLQQELFSQQTIDQSLDLGEFADNPSPFGFIDIADVRVSVYHLELPEFILEKESFSSFKLKNYRFVNADELINGILNLRQGVGEMALGYLKYLDALEEEETLDPIYINSNLNQKLALLSLDY